MFKERISDIVEEPMLRTISVWPNRKRQARLVKDIGCSQLRSWRLMASNWSKDGSTDMVGGWVRLNHERFVVGFVSSSAAGGSDLISSRHSESVRCVDSSRATKWEDQGRCLWTNFSCTLDQSESEKETCLPKRASKLFLSSCYRIIADSIRFPSSNIFSGVLASWAARFHSLLTCSASTATAQT